MFQKSPTYLFSALMTFSASAVFPDPCGPVKTMKPAGKAKKQED